MNRVYDCLLPSVSLAVGLLLSACTKTPTEEGPPSKESSAQQPAAATKAEPVTLQGSGASFPAPLYSRWFQEFSKKHDDIRVNYQSTGSGAGVKAFSEGQTDFGASDAAMSDEELQKAGFPILMLPVTAGNVVLGYNVEGVPELKLSREAYTGIFLGDIKKWNDPKIAKQNPDAKLPNEDITVVRRSDGSGTTFVFTQHLSAISDKWKEGPGTGKSIDWPVGVGGRKNDGVAALVKQTPGAIGYLEFSYAKSAGIPMASLENKAGKYVAPTLEASSVGLEGVEMPDNLRAWVTDPEGDGAYPIVTYTWILAKKDYADDNKAKALKQLLDYVLTDGQELSTSLYYVPLPKSVAAKVQKAVDTIQ